MAVLLQDGDQLLIQIGDALLEQAAVGEDALLANDVESASELTTPALGQEHTLLADDIQSTSEVSTPALGQTHTLLAVSVESGSEVNAPSLADIPAGVNALFADDVESPSQVSVPTLTLVSDAKSGGSTQRRRDDNEVESELCSKCTKLYIHTQHCINNRGYAKAY